jgi:hypothetical protein
LRELKGYDPLKIKIAVYDTIDGDFGLFAKNNYSNRQQLPAQDSKKQNK